MNGDDEFIWHRDTCGNYFHNTLKVEGDRITRTDVFRLERGKTTLRGEHQKFKDTRDCNHPERLSCDNGLGFSRCEHMQYLKNGHYSYTEGSWACIFKRVKKHKPLKA